MLHLETPDMSIFPFWAIPTAIAAFLIHGGRLWLLDRRLAKRRAAQEQPA